MQASAVPYKFATPWAADAASGDVTNPIPATASGAAASQQQGFPLATATPVASGGTPPNFADFNGFGYYMSAWLQWLQGGGPIVYDATFSSAIGGYPKGAVLASQATFGQFWISSIDNNMTDPDTGGGNWQTIQSQANTWSGTNTYNATVVANDGILAGQDANGFNLKFYSSTYESGFRNDGANTYLLLTGSSGGGYNSFFPFYVTNATAAVTIDQTGAGTTFGGPIYPAGGYLTGGVSNPIANTANGNQVLGNGTEQIYNATMTPLSIGVGFIGQMVDFYYGSAATGSISYDGTRVLYNSTSDYRVKTIHGAADGTWLSGLPVHDAAFKSAPTVRMPLLLAHEVQAFLPSAVTGSKDATDADGKPVMQQLDMTVLVPSMIAYIQSLEKRIVALEAK